MSDPQPPRVDTTWVRDVGRGVGAILRDHAAFVFIVLTMVGASYELFLYLQFRVNILQFAEPLDYLFAAVRQPVVLVFTVLPVVLLWLLAHSDRWVGRQIPAYGRWTERNRERLQPRRLQPFIYTVFVVVYFALFTIKYAEFVASRLRAGKGRPVRVELAPADSSRTRYVGGTLLGTTAKFVFVYTHADSGTHAIPIESIIEMQVLRRPGSKR